MSDRQNCGNILAGVGPFAVERGLVPAADGETSVRDPHGQLRQRRRRHLPDPGRARGVPRATSRSPASRAPPRRSCSPSPTPRARRPARCCRPATSGTRSRASRSPASTTACRSSWPLAESFGLTGLRDRTRSWPRTPACSSGSTPSAARPRAHGPGRRLARLGAEDGAARARRATAGRSAPGRSSRCSRTPRSACSARSASSPACCCRARSGTSSPRDWPQDTSQVDVEHPTGHLLVDVVVDSAVDAAARVRSGVVRTARKLFDGTAFPRA